MKTRFATITLLALIIVAASSQLTFAAAGDGTQIYVHLRTAAESRQEELLYLLEEDLSPNVMDSLQQAMQLMQQAETASTEGLQMASQYYMDALRCFRETWELYLAQDEDVSANTLEEIEPDTAPEIVITEELENEIKIHKVRQLEKFQEKIEEKYADFTDDVEEMTTYLPEDDSEEAQKTYTKAQEKLEKIRSKIEKGDVDDALSSLNEDLGSLEDDLVFLKDKNETKTQRKTEVMNEKARQEKLEKEKKEKDSNRKDKDNGSTGNNSNNSNNGNSNSNNGNSGNQNNSNSNNSTPTPRITATMVTRRMETAKPMIHQIQTAKKTKPQQMTTQTTETAPITGTQMETAKTMIHQIPTTKMMAQR